MSIYKVGDNLTLNLGERKLFKGSTEVTLPELSYRLLVCLVERAPNVVSHDILLDFVWQGKVVSEDTIKKRVSRLREVLAVGKEQDLIIAERGLGYRLNLSVKTIEQTVSLQEQQNSPKLVSPQFRYSIRHRVMLSGLVIFGIIAFGVFKQTEPSKIQQPEQVRKSLSSHDPSSELNVARFMGLQNSSKIDSAISELENSIKHASNKVAIFSILSELYLTKHKLYGANQDDLIQAYQFALKAVNASNSQPWPYVALGNVQIEQGKYKNAIESASKAISLSPKWVNAHAVKSSALNHRGDISGAWQAIQIAHKLQPDNPLVQKIRVQVLLNKNMFSWSERHLDSLIASSPQDAFYSLTQAEYFLEIKHYEKAEITLNELLTLKPNFIEAHLLMASALELQGKMDKSLVHLKRVAHSQSKHAQLAQLLANLVDGNNRNVKGKTSEGVTYSNHFIASLLTLNNKDPEQFIQLAEKAVQNGFSKEYLLESNIIDTSLEQQVQSDKLFKDYQALKTNLFNIKQARRVKRVPIL
ncbi:winged helix-turn-helix domain-containing protein [Pseudoalteromonas sp. SS15]|uniref:winged helix-turn-helix domain-containing protein n=1 Tax=Pseudoalteromonas sp. SS15 TaxID=3139393 RepID=UPI003BACE9F0